ncbi:MAG: dephospho-CoA kinase [Bacteroides sp.]|nr:dephospho-CoA kinase [Bacteroides sp.]MCM1412776.1 dephospho-CoA kinase [Bacteroides sp.]MCM1470930.1 dephospho-CoA kinase [Bacteroides sp.]
MSRDNIIIAVCGGIGAGKSVVCEMLRVMGFEVYDCDSRARDLMDCSDEIKRRISEEISAEAILADGSIDRAVLGEVVFADKQLLNRLNSLVHGAVRDDIRSWAVGKHVCFVETAILYESGLDAMVDYVWEVIAPVDVRVRRVMSRNGLSEQQVMARIRSQELNEVARRMDTVVEIVNDGLRPVLPQVERLLALTV